MKKVFIDGSAGTTGLRIADRLADREDLTIFRLPESLRKDPIARKEAINSADIVFLCLPDGAAMEAVSLVENPNVKIIDTSTAHRVNPDWTYGFPELAGQREKIRNSKKVGYGYNAYAETYVDMINAGIVDPTKVTRSSLENAASIASCVLTTESLVVDKPDPAADAAAAAAAAQGGMY